MNMNQKIGIIGGGNAGLISALVLRAAFPKHEITIVKSDKIGTIGVGEGATEHWLGFMNFCGIEPAELIVAALATHKKGIRFEGWTDHTPDYFHVTSGLPDFIPQMFGFNGAYAGLLSKEWLLTEHTCHKGLLENKVPAHNPHRSVNQFHFDTEELNDFLMMKVRGRNIKIIDGEVQKVVVRDDWITTVELNDPTASADRIIRADFWIDASGFNKVLISHLSKQTWNSFSEYLLTDSAIAFRTPSDESGEIKPYTRARALNSGWAWEIPTQVERGNGYVYSSSFCTEEEAVAEMEELLDVRISDHRHFQFDPGHLEEPWVGNCVAVGLAGSFVEPLEATSIGSTITQIKSLIGYLASFQKGNEWIPKEYNRHFNGMMSNILDMIRLHYISDRTDTPFWSAMQNAPIPESLERLLGLWSERPPQQMDFIHGELAMFGLPHFYHVGQGQGVLNPDSAFRAIQAFAWEDSVEDVIWKIREGQSAHPIMDHHEALENLQ